MSSDQPAPLVEPADLVAAAVLAVPGVRALHGGASGEIGTYLPGRRVAGVRLGADRCSAHVVLDWDADVRQTAEAVRAAVRAVPQAVPEGAAVDVIVEDVVAPAGPRSR
ncbi:hypothetical protein ABFT23_06805 [Nocardioides sp. C4-1]|uniref:hypothetical protein n=1 Tax=Nocardioides sp. C4-1 TaxID=3151851 RepID=UPI003262D3BA